MKSKKRKPLTQAEIERVVEKIRQRYRDYAIEFVKNPRCFKDFEDRYFDARKYQMDMETFLFAELSVVEELIKKERASREKDIAKAMGTGTRAGQAKKEGQKKEKKKTFADSIMEENLRRISGYDEGFASDDASEEMIKLIGALNRLEREYWSSAEPMIRRALGKKAEERLRMLDYALLNFTCGGKSPPKALSQYVVLIRGGSRDPMKAEREEKRLILEIAFLLHGMEDITGEALSNIGSGSDARKIVEKMYDFVHNVIEDFRLKDLRPESFTGG